MNIGIAIIIVMLSFAVMAGGLVMGFGRYQKRIGLKQRELYRLDVQYRQELLSTSIQSAETERIRIAKDIHDEIGSIFSTLSLSINQLKVEKEYNTGHYQNCKSLVQTGIKSVRRISHAIIPFEISILGLEQTLENYFDSISFGSGLAAHFENDLREQQLTDAAALAVYRVVQELTSNTIKYANAKQLFLSLRADEQSSSIFIFYKDDGAGASPEMLRSKTGIGLKNIESRALSLNGTVSFVSTPGAGFSCRIVIPFLKNTVSC